MGKKAKKPGGGGATTPRSDKSAEPSVGGGGLSSVTDILQENEAKRRANVAAMASQGPRQTIETDLTVELMARRRALIAKSLQQELELGDLMQHEVFLEQRAQELLTLREEIARNHRLAHAKLQLARQTDKRGEPSTRRRAYSS